jgi:hypothetical protein
MPKILRTEPILFDVPSYGRRDLKVQQFADDGQGNLYLRAPKGLFRRDVGAGGWVHVEEIVVKYKQYVEHIDAREGLLFVLNSKGTLYRSADQGRTFKAKAARAKGANRVLYNPAFDVALVGGDTNAWAGRTQREVGAFVTGTSQKSPGLVHVGRFESMWPCCLHGDAIVSGLRQVKAVRDPELGWDELEATPGRELFFDFLVSTDEALIGATSKDYNDPVTVVSRSGDGGATWEQVYAGDAQVVALTADPEGRVVAATKQDLIASSDHGATWHVAARDADVVFDQVHLCGGELWASVFAPEGYEEALVDDQERVLVHVFAFPEAPEAAGEAEPGVWARRERSPAPELDVSGLPGALRGRADDEVVDMVCALYLDPDTLLTSDATGRLSRWTRGARAWSLEATLLDTHPRPVTAMIVDGEHVLAARRGELFVFDPSSGEVRVSHPVERVYFWLHRHGDVVVAGHNNFNSHDGEVRLDGLDRFCVEGDALVELEALPEITATTNFRVTLNHVDALGPHVLYVNKIPNTDGAIWKVFDLETEEVVDGSSKSLREVGLMPSDHGKLWAVPKKVQLKTGINAATARGGKNQGVKRGQRGYVTHIPGKYVVDRAPGDYGSYSVMAIEPFAHVATARDLSSVFPRGTQLGPLAPDASSLLVASYGSTPHAVDLASNARAPLGTLHAEGALEHARVAAFEGAWSGLAADEERAVFLHERQLMELDLATGAVTTLGGPVDAQVGERGWLVGGHWVAVSRQGGLVVYALETGALVHELEVDGEHACATGGALYVLAPPEDEREQEKPQQAIWRVDLGSGELARVAPEVLGVARMAATHRGLFAVWYDHGMGGEYVYYDEETGAVTGAAGINLYTTPRTQHGSGWALMHGSTRGSGRVESWLLHDVSAAGAELAGAGFVGALGHPTVHAGKARAYAYAAASGHVLAAFDEWTESKGVRVSTSSGYRLGVIETPTTPDAALIASPTPRRFFLGSPAGGFDLVAY